MTRFVPVTVVVVVMALLAANRVASAEDTSPTGPLASGASITFSELQIHENNSPNLDFPETDPESKWQYFNLAHCQCSQANPGPEFHEGTFAYLLQLQGANGVPVSRPLEIWVGSNCMSDAARPPSMTATCHKVGGLNSVDELTTPGNIRPEIPIFDFMTPTPGATDCLENQGSSTLWALVDTNGNNLPDYFASQQITTDSLLPPLPTDFRASGGEGAIVISWKPPVDASDIYAYQALCARADDNSPGKTTGQPPRRYQTGSNLCGLPPSVDLGTGTSVPPTPGAPDAGTPLTLVDLPAGLANLDPTFLCGDEFSPTATSLRISGLENGVAYKVVLLAVDKFQNASGTFFTSTITPVPSTDFWEDLHGRGSEAEGGLCLLAETYGDDSFLTRALRAFRDDTLGGSFAGRWLTDAYYATIGKLGASVHGSIAWRLIAAVVLAPLVMLALLWHWLTLPGVIAVIALMWLWRRRRIAPPQVARLATAGMAMLVLAPGRAHAEGYQPYWETTDFAAEQNQVAPDDPSLVDWHAGIRVGPFIPDIDKQLGMDPGPYEQMFGGYRILPMLDVDRILWTGFGQVGVGGSVGYMQKSARAFVAGSSPSDPDRLRVADINKFRLIPMAVTATYRFTWLDDAYGIPVVPYVRGGLSYYLWWLSTADGSLAQACKDGGMEPDCSHTKALGGSLGVQGSIGLAVRAERIDASTAISMRQSGIQHAGIYGELSLAKVDGFGSETKLSVGDRTWFAGVDFEF